VGGVYDVLVGAWGGTGDYARTGAFCGAPLAAALDEGACLSEVEIAARKAYARKRYGVFRLVDDHSALYKGLLAKKGLPS
jgi:hypothetical protein